jgi:hypothetical protein
MVQPYLHHYIACIEADNHYICMADCMIANICNLIEVRYD